MASFTLTGRTALITGASSGLGASFATELARRHANLVLVARSGPVLTATARRLSDEHGIRAEVIVQDLAAEGAAAVVAERIDQLGLHIDLLVNNAGFATQGRFETIAAGRDPLPGRLRRHQGVRYLLQPGPVRELAGRGVRVLTLCPGPVDTAFFDVLGSRAADIGQHLDPSTVITGALDALTAGRALLVPGWRNRLTARAVTLLPRRLVLAAAKRATRRVIAG